MRFVKLLEKFGIKGLQRFEGGEAKKRQLTGDEKWRILKSIGKEDDNFLFNNFNDLEIEKVVRQWVLEPFFRNPIGS